MIDRNINIQASNVSDQYSRDYKQMNTGIPTANSIGSDPGFLFNKYIDLGYSYVMKVS